MKKVISYCLMVVALLVVLSGCSKPPEMEMKAAKAAITAAQTAEAEMYVPAMFRAAMDSMTAADKNKVDQDKKSALSRDYAKAKALYIAAEKTAKKAAGEAATAKVAVQNDAAKLAVDAKAALDKVVADVKKVKENKKNKADLDAIKADLAAAEAAFASANADNQAGKFMDAKNKFGGIIAMTMAVPEKLANAGKAPAKPAAAKPAPAKPAPKKKK